MMSTDRNSKGILERVEGHLDDFTEVKRHILCAKKEILLAGTSTLEVLIGWIDKEIAPKKKVEKIDIE